jgi:methane monooxygenase component A beta chain/propane monooxygenase small subunit
MQAEQERAVELAVEGGVNAGVFTEVSPVWLREVLGRHYRVWTYFEYGMFRACAQAQREALADTLGGVLCFEAVDRMRHAQDIILYLMNLEKAVAGFADDGAKAEWLNEPLYQPARKMTEEIMALNDWGELAVAVNLVIDPLFSEVGVSQLIRRSAPYHGDSVTPMLVLFAERDRQRNLAWTVELVKMVTAPELEQCEHNRRTIQDWITRWSPLAWHATEALAPVFERVPITAVRFDDALRLARESQAAMLSGLGFAPA